MALAAMSCLDSGMQLNQQALTVGGLYLGLYNLTYEVRCTSL